MTRPTDPLTLTHRQWRPHYESRPYRQHPSRTRHIYGELQPMYAAPRIPWSKLITGAVMAPCVIYAVALWIKP